MTKTLTDQPKVLLVGDTHGNPEALRDAFFEADAIGAIAIIQLGDYGFGWSTGEDGIDDFAFLTAEMVEQTGIPFYWIDGNHENFDKLLALPIDPETGLRPILKGVNHIPRGATLTLGNTTFMGFGGAHSVDKMYRSEGYSWWVQETVTEADLAKAIENSGKAQVFLSHDAPFGIQDVKNLTAKLTQWGREATEMSIANQRIVRQALDASGATKAFHGHLHQRYEQWLDNGTENGVLVHGINRDEERGNTFILEV